MLLPLLLLELLPVTQGRELGARVLAPDVAGTSGFWDLLLHALAHLHYVRGSWAALIACFAPAATTAMRNRKNSISFPSTLYSLATDSY